MQRERECTNGTTAVGARTSVSVKGIVTISSRIVLLRNERMEWELPGGRPDGAEQPEATLEREVLEEIGLTVKARDLVDVWTYRSSVGTTSLIVTYTCEVEPSSSTSLILSDEHNSLLIAEPDQLTNLPLPLGYARSVWRSTRRHAQLLDVIAATDPSELCETVHEAATGEQNEF